MAASSSQAPDLRDPTAVALEITAIKGQVELLAEKISQGLNSLAQQVNSLQGDLRDHSRILRGVQTAQHDMQTHSQGLERLAQAIERQSSDFAGWRDRHEADNRTVADRVTTFRGVLVAALALATVIAGVLVYNQDLRFTSVDDRLDAHKDMAHEAHQGIDRRIDRLEAATEKRAGAPR
jgi:ABC-type transporter Mla subunit MlaD